MKGPRHSERRVIQEFVAEASRSLSQLSPIDGLKDALLLPLGACRPAPSLTVNVRPPARAASFSAPNSAADAAHHARRHVSRLPCRLAALDQRHRLDAERGEGGEAAEEAGEEQEPQLERQEIPVFGDADQDAAIRQPSTLTMKVPAEGTARCALDQAPNLVARHRTHRTARGDEQHFIFLSPTGTEIQLYPRHHSRAVEAGGDELAPFVAFDPR